MSRGNAGEANLDEGKKEKEKERKNGAKRDEECAARSYFPKDKSTAIHPFCSLVHGIYSPPAPPHPRLSTLLCRHS